MKTSKPIICCSESPDDVVRVDVFWQLAVLVLVLALAGLINRYLRSRLVSTSRWAKSGAASSDRVLFPLSTLRFRVAWQHDPVRIYRVRVLKLAAPATAGDGGDPAGSVPAALCVS